MDRLTGRNRDEVTVGDVAVYSELSGPVVAETIDTLTIRARCADGITRDVEMLRGALMGVEIMESAALSLPDFNSCDYHAGHRCRRCQVHITDMEYIAAGLFFSLCPACLASARQTVREMSA